MVIIPPEPDEVTDEEGIDDDVLQENVLLPKDIAGEVEILSSKKTKNPKKGLVRKRVKIKNLNH